jgi:hypothetical protein
MSTLAVNTITTQTGSDIVVAPGKNLLAHGNTINIYEATKTDVQSMTGYTFVDITGLSITLTPVSASSKFLIHYAVVASSDYYKTYINLLRNGTLLGANADGAGDNRYRGTSAHATDMTISNAHGIVHNHSITFLDSPATTGSLTYKLQSAGRGSTYVSYINRSVPDRAFGEYDDRTVSRMIIQEIAG